MYIISYIIFSIILMLISIKSHIKKIQFKLTVWVMIVFLTSAGIIDVLILAIDHNHNQQPLSTKVCSGRVISCNHKEEWKKWIPNQYKKVSIKNSKGKIIKYKNILTILAHWEYHPSENQIKTSDGGVFVTRMTPSRNKIFDDRWPNSTEELQKYWKVGSPSASIHIAKDKIRTTYNKYKKVDLIKYKGLPKYPCQVHDYIYIDRILGNVPNKVKALQKLSEVNSKLNEKTKNSNNNTKMNIIFVNIGDKPKEYGAALQDKWRNGNKNDFIICFSMDKQGFLKWVYPFSWINCKSLDTEIKDFMLSKKQIKDFVPIISKTSQLVEKHIKREEFSHFNPSQMQPTRFATFLIWLVNSILLLMCLYLEKLE